jgi:hypothetical protein
MNYVAGFPPKSAGTTGVNVFLWIGNAEYTYKKMVPEAGIEPARPLFTKAADFKGAIFELINRSQTQAGIVFRHFRIKNGSMYRSI